MKYKGKELIEMLPANWDGNTRQMLVWNDNDDDWQLACVIGYTYIPVMINGFTDYKWQWICTCTGPWAHCADVPEEEPDACSGIENLKAENDELKARIKTLRVERGEMANAVSSAVWKELMDRAEQNKVIGSLQLPAGFGFNDISDIVLNKIIDYKPEKKLRRMTYKELDEWLEQGKGVVRIGDKVRDTISYDCESRNQEVSGYYKICGYDEDTWHYPMIEV